jgi:hypothetical protein
VTRRGRMIHRYESECRESPPRIMAYGRVARLSPRRCLCYSDVVSVIV